VGTRADACVPGVDTGQTPTSLPPHRLGRGYCFPRPPHGRGHCFPRPLHGCRHCFPRPLHGCGHCFLLAAWLRAAWLRALFRQCDSPYLTQACPFLHLTRTMDPPPRRRTATWVSAWIWLKIGPIRSKRFRGPGPFWIPHPDPNPSLAGVSAMAPAVLCTTGADTTAFFWHRLLHGGIPFTTDAGSPAYILWTQFTHEQPRAASRHARPSNPAHPYDTRRAFRFWHLRPASPTPPPSPLRGGRAASSGGLPHYKQRALLRAATCSPGSILTSNGWPSSTGPRGLIT
jgi:hypothetical protein